MKEFLEEYCIILIFAVVASIFLTLSLTKMINAQTKMSATVEKSAYYLCQQKCEELINVEF